MLIRCPDFADVLSEAVNVGTLLDIYPITSSEMVSFSTHVNSLETEHRANSCTALRPLLAVRPTMYHDTSLAKLCLFRFGRDRETTILPGNITSRS